MSSYYEGTTVKVVTTVPFTNLLETPPAPTTPETVILDVYVDGTQQAQYLWTVQSGDPTDTIINFGAGLFYALLNTTGLVGQWTYQWWGTGIVTALAARSFIVREKPLAITS